MQLFVCISVLFVVYNILYEMIDDHFKYKKQRVNNMRLEIYRIQAEERKAEFVKKRKELMRSVFRTPVWEGPKKTNYNN